MNILLSINRVCCPKNSFPSLRITETRKALGQAHGEHFKGLILDLIEARTDVLHSEFNSLNDEYTERVRRYALAATEVYTPQIYEEVIATAEVCEVPYWKMIVCGGFTDVLDVFRIDLSTKQVRDHAECTTPIQAAAKTISGTWDSNSKALDAAVLLPREPRDTEISSISKGAAKRVFSRSICQAWPGAGFVHLAMVPSPLFIALVLRSNGSLADSVAGGLVSYITATGRDGDRRLGRGTRSGRGLRQGLYALVSGLGNSRRAFTAVPLLCAGSGPGGGRGADPKAFCRVSPRPQRGNQPRTRNL